MGSVGSVHATEVGLIIVALTLTPYVDFESEPRRADWCRSAHCRIIDTPTAGGSGELFSAIPHMFAGGVKTILIRTGKAHVR
jgi:hypothetical protein